METINRKSLIYKTKVEYGDYTLNHVEGCAHGCKYPCYAMLMAKRFGKIANEEEWVNPKIVNNAYELLVSELPKIRDKVDNIHLCFTTDPFMFGYKDIEEMSLKIIRKINDEGIKCSVLTKGILPKALEECSKENKYGITLISLDEKFRKEIEPNAAPYIDRIKSLKYLSDKGFKTWVSIEPYPTPNIIDQSLSGILESVSFTNKIIFGRINYNRVVSEYKEAKVFFDNSAREVIEFCKNRKIESYIKKGTMLKDN